MKDKIYELQQFVMSMRKEQMSDQTKILILDLIKLLADKCDDDEKRAVYQLFDYVVVNL